MFAQPFTLYRLYLIVKKMTPPPSHFSSWKGLQAHFLEIHLPDSGVAFHSTLSQQYVKRRASSELKVIEKQFRSKGMLLQSHCSNTKHHGKCLSVFSSFLTLLYFITSSLLSSTMPGFPKLSQLRYHFLPLSCFLVQLVIRPTFFHFVCESFVLFSQKGSLTHRARILS